MTVHNAYKVITPNGSLWAVAKNHLVCILAGRPLAIACQAESRALTEGVTLGVVGHPGDLSPDSKRRFTLYGIVPDSYPTVRVRVGARHRTIPVEDNSYSYMAKEPVVLDLR
jgi:hypothetical protein